MQNILVFLFFTFSRLVNLLDFIQRIDVLTVITLLTGNIGKISGYLYFTTIAFTQTINKKDNRPYIIPTAIIMLIVTVLIKDRRSLLSVGGEALQEVILISSFITIFILPLITTIVYFF